MAVTFGTYTWNKRPDYQINSFPFILAIGQHVFGFLCYESWKKILSVIFINTFSIRLELGSLDFEINVIFLKIKKGCCFALMSWSILLYIRETMPKLLKCKAWFPARWFISRLCNSKNRSSSINEACANENMESWHRVTLIKIQVCVAQ